MSRSSVVRIFAICLALPLALATSHAAKAQCGEKWLTGPGALQHANEQLDIVTMTAWNRGGEIVPVAAGRFAIAGSQNIAWYDGAGWQPLGPGLAGQVLAIHQHQGQLIAGGEFSQHIAMWDGGQWQAIGGGLSAPVRAIITWNGDLIGITDRLHRWNGTTWQLLSNTTVPSASSAVVHNNELIVACGAHPFITRWDGAAWHHMGVTEGQHVSDLAVFQGDLYAAGWFKIGGSTELQGVARWTGATWEHVGGSTSGSAGAMEVHDGGLYVAGQLNGTGATGMVRQWDGSAWHSTFDGLTIAGAGAMATTGDRLFIGGAFGQGGITPTMVYSMVLNDQSWVPATGGPLWRGGRGINALASTGDELIAGGQFDTVGEAWSPRIAAWDGIDWHGMAGGFPQHSIHNPTIVRSATVFQGQPVVAGSEAVGTRRWTGTGWQSLQGGVDGYLSASENYIYAAYTFFATSGTQRWSTAAGWETIHPQPLLPLFAVSDNEVFAGSRRWDGQNWTTLGESVSNIGAVTVYNDDLIIAGAFTSIGGNPINRISRWDGAVWQPLGSGVNDTVLALAVYNGDLIAGGDFSVAGGSPVSHIARWDGASWRPLGTGLQLTGPQAVRALAVHGPELIVGGNFAMAGGKASGGFARWTDTGAPWVAHHPADQHSTTGAQVQFTAAAARGYEDLSWQWRHNGTPLSDGPTSHGTMISGSTTPTLTISNIRPVDIGSYDVVLANTCGQDTSNASILSLDGACYANCDGSMLPPVLNVDDFTCFINEFAASQTLAPTQQITAYANCDGSTVAPVLNVDDFTCFINAFAAGCP